MFSPIEPSGLHDNITALLYETLNTDISTTLIVKAFNCIARGVYDVITAKTVSEDSITIYNSYSKLNLCSIHRGSRVIVFYSHSVRQGDRSIEALFDILLCFTNRKSFNNVVTGYRAQDGAIQVHDPVTGMVTKMYSDGFFVDFIGKIDISKGSNALSNFDANTTASKYPGLLFRKGGMTL